MQQSDDQIAMLGCPIKVPTLVSAPCWLIPLSQVFHLLKTMGQLQDIIFSKPKIGTLVIIKTWLESVLELVGTEYI